jgi:hypothetical protein
MATKFTKAQFVNHSGYVTYPIAGEQQFVARFKHVRSGASSFITFLVKHFTVEEYFARLTAGETPLKIAESKGYLLPHIKRWLKEGGYPVSIEGRNQMTADNIARYQARMAQEANA